MKVPSLRGQAVFRKLPAASLPTQAFLLMAVSITLVSGALIWHQGDSIKTEVLAERLAAISRHALVLEAHVGAAGAGADRAAIARSLAGEVDESLHALGAVQVVVTDETGLVVASTDRAAVGHVEPAEEVQLILSGAAQSVVRPEKGAETIDFSFAIPITFPAFRGVLLIEEDTQALTAAIGAATWQSALPALLLLLLVAPLAAVVARRILWRTQKSEARALHRFQSLVQNASDVIVILDATGVIQYATPAMERVLGRTAAEVNAMRGSDLIHPDDLDSARSAFFSPAEAPGRITRSEFRIRHADGRWVFAEVHSANLRDDPAVGGTVLTIRDVSERKTLEAQLTHQALHDSLTGLANRALFNDRLAHAVARTRRGGKGLSVLVIDLDEFKLVNDNRGHPAGDTVLARVGQRIEASTREGDTVARLGGDEFAILLEDVSPDDVAPISARILASFEEAIPIEGGDLVVRASIGVAHGGEGLIDTADLLTWADIAMYAAKDSGKGRLTVFEPGMRMAANERTEATAELRRAIDEGQLEVRYQPIVELPSGTIRSMEALVRWRHPTRGTVMPAEFIPLAEKTGLIVSLGEFVLREACRQARAWQLDSSGVQPLTMSVNVSAVQLQDPGLIDAVRTALNETGLPPATLTLEITESVLADDVEAITSRLHELKDLGIRLAIDDFGTGFSSLSYLRRFPIDVIKIDKSFVDGLGASEPALALAKSIVRLARNLQLNTVAEGVEEPQQRALLAAMGCDAAQGYLFAEPLDVAAATAYLRTAPGRLAAAG